MNYGPLVFLAAFFALAASWFGFVLTPQVQLGRQQQETNSVNTAELYPQARPGAAHQGLEVYRANGCAACHSQQVRQTGVVVDVVLTEAGTNLTAVVEALKMANADATPAGVAGGLPKAILQSVTIDTADAVVKALKATSAKAEARVIPVGPDISRGWGLRRTVAADFLYDNPVMLGSLRVGPDLANVGSRLPDADRHLRHLYSPQADVKGSAMPSYRFLFETRRIQGQPSPDALQPLNEFAAPEGYEIVPKPEARQLVAYLLSLRSDTPLFEAPMYAPVAPAPAPTNAPAK
jgi:cbb3-type cytochrome oxidase cytochrome c subunit